MSKCSKCGEEIIWIRMQSGKNMPVNSIPVLFKVDKAGKDRAVHKDGFIAAGTIISDWKSASFLGHVPHWATCPYAGEYRKAIPKRNDTQKRIDPEPEPEKPEQTEQMTFF